MNGITKIIMHWPFHPIPQPSWGGALWQESGWRKNNKKGNGMKTSPCP